MARPLSWLAAPVSVCARAADPAAVPPKEAPATLADAAGEFPGQAATVPAAMPARARAEPAAMSVILGVLRYRALRYRALRYGIVRSGVLRWEARLLADNVNL